DGWADGVRGVPGGRLRIGGGGDDRVRLESKARMLGLDGRVTFLGRIDDRALDQEYRDCTAFAMPSRDEGFGFVFVEAMRAARACVGAHGAASEIIEDGVTGLLVDPADRRALAAAVVRLLADRVETDRMGERGRARFLRDFTDLGFRERFTALLATSSAISHSPSAMSQPR